MRFYRDLGQNGKSASDDLGTILTAAFLNAHDATWKRDYGFIRNSVVTISGVRGDLVDYTANYDYVSDKPDGPKLSWQRSGTWSVVYGSSGWQLNDDTWSSIHIVALTSPDGKQYSVQDRVFSDGRHVFDLAGYEATFSATAEGTWNLKTVALATPAPSEPTQSADTYRPPYTVRYVVPPARYVAPVANCEDDSIQTVGDDGAILVMLSGAVYHVAEYDTSSSSIWLTADDVIICGSRIVNKDESGEAVEAQRVR